jgi:restriction system protein
MSRPSPIENLFYALRRAPWWAGVAAAVVFVVVGLVVTGGLTKDAAQLTLRPFIRFIFSALAILALTAAIVSACQARRRRRLLDRQASLESLRALSSGDVADLIGEQYRRQGYKVEETGGPDGAVDLVLRGHGETVLVQCGQWRERQVGVAKVRELVGAVSAAHATRGILVTSGSFSADALSFKPAKPLTLVDGPALVQLVREAQSSRRR